MSLHWDGDGAIEERDFVVGFLEEGEVIGRPVDVAEGVDGTIYVSDDYAGAIYRVRFGGADADAAVAERGGAAARDAVAGLGARGAALYAEHDCGRCHDLARAVPGVVTVPLDDLGARYEPGSLAAFLAAPTPPMPLFPLDEGARRDLAAHLLERFD